MLDTTELDDICQLILNWVDPEELVDLLNLDIEDLVEALRAQIAAADPDTWSYLIDRKEMGSSYE